MKDYISMSKETWARIENESFAYTQGFFDGFHNCSFPSSSEEYQRGYTDGTAQRELQAPEGCGAEDCDCTCGEKDD